MYKDPKVGVVGTNEEKQVQLKRDVSMSTREGGQVGVVPMGPRDSQIFSKSVLEFMKRKSGWLLVVMETTLLIHPLAGGDTGPFQLLKACLESAAPVRVWTRHCVGVRGVCEGLLLAFDKHMNVVLGNVTENYTPFRTRANGGVESTWRRKKRKKKKKGEEHQTDIESTAATETDQLAIEGSVVPIATSCTKMSCSLISKDKSPSVFQSSRCAKKLFVQGSNVVLISTLNLSQSDITDPSTQH